jgi:hypothetical protein
MSDSSAVQFIDDVEMENQESEDLIRHGYSVRVSGSQTFVVPTTLQEVDISLANMRKPDISGAVKMPAGVTIIFSRNMNILLIFFFLLPLWTLYTDPDSDHYLETFSCTL